ncbi:MAG: hypothetical protein ACYTDU_12750 [Planctomycetota bacterium]|jgi:asparagine synthetase B (glutamine-hydrolysing)
MCGLAAMVATNGARTDRGALERMLLLAAYRECGRGCLPRLNGMCAFLIYEGRG